MPIRNDRDAVLHSARCHIPNLFFVGPFGARVSFASQQRRAINLVWALIQDKVISTEREVDVAIIGGGIAGLTAAAALLTKNCNVWIYEKEGEVLSLQKATHHRLVHPTINFWPEEALNLTTDLPFFDWYADHCDSIMKLIRDEWDRWFSKELSDIYLNKNVTAFDYDEEKDKVEVCLGPPKKRVKHGEFDLVLVTTGFGYERDSDPNQKSYWDQDEIDKWALRTERKYAVSGTGDGGIIDTLRLVYPGFMSDEMALKYLQVIDKKPLRTKLIDIEEKAEAIDDPNERAKFYNKEYRSVAASRTLKAKGLLPQPPAEKEKVTLIGRLEHPFEISAAPIHRLILAHTLNEERLNYLRGKVFRKKGAYYLEDEQTGAVTKLDFEKVIVRHGTDKPVVSFLGDVAAQEMEANQRLIGDYLSIRGFARNFYDNPTMYPKRGASSLDFVENRQVLAEGLVERFGLVLSIDSSNPKRLKFQAYHKDPDRKVASEINVPTNIFSIELIPPAEGVVRGNTLVGSAKR